jgi:hypothetical protein
MHDVQKQRYNNLKSLFDVIICIFPTFNAEMRMYRYSSVALKSRPGLATAGAHYSAAIPEPPLGNDLFNPLRTKI